MAPIRPRSPMAGKREAAFHLFHIRSQSVSVILIFCHKFKLLTHLKQERLQASNFSFLWQPSWLSLVAPSEVRTVAHLQGSEASLPLPLTLR